MRHLPLAAAVLVAALTFLPQPKPATGVVATALAGASRADRHTLRGIYLGLAEKTAEDNGTRITTVGMWRAWHSETLKWSATKLKGKYPGLDVAVEKVMADHFPLEDVAMSDQVVDKINAACREVAKQSE